MANASELWAETNKIKGAHKGRNDKIIRQLRLLALKDDNKEDELISLITNDPASLFWLAVSILSDRPSSDRVLVGDQGEHAQKQAGKAERGLKGFWKLRDRDALRSDGEVWNREFAFWACLGHYYTSAWLDSGPDGTPRPIADVLSPLETFHRSGMDGQGPQAVVHEYETTVSEARDHAIAMNGNPSRVQGSRLDANVTVRDYWWREPSQGPDRDWDVWYTVMVRGQGKEEYILPPTFMEQFLTVPIMTGSVAGRPLRGFKKKESLKPGQGILDQNETIYDFINKILTGYARVARLYQRAPWLATGIGLNVSPEEVSRDETFDIEGALFQSTNPQANLRRVDPGRSPIEIRDLFEISERLTERGGLSRALYGVLDASPSGFAISRIITSASHKLIPYATRGEFVRQDIGEMWLRQYKDGDFSPFLVEGTEEGVAEEFMPDDVPERFSVRSEKPLALPSDRAERINLARQVIPTGPLMSRRSMQDVLLAGIIDDPVLDSEWLGDDMVEAHPISQAIVVVARMRTKVDELKKAGKNRMATSLTKAADVLEAGLESQLGIPGAPATSRPPRQESLPTEMATGSREDMLRSALSAPQGMR